MSHHNSISSGVLMIGLIAAAAVASAAPPLSVRYRVLEGTLLTRTDPAGVVEATPLTGTLDLVATESPADFTIKQFRGFDPAGVERATGKGTYAFNFGYHAIALDLLIDGEAHHLDSGWLPFETYPPMIIIDAAEKASPGLPVHELHLQAVPFLAPWFSTTLSFHTPAGDLISHGDVLTGFGRVLWTNHELTQKLGIQPIVPDIGVDALYPVEIDSPPWWECWFSADDDVFSEKLGPLDHGDFLSSGGFIVARNADLVKNFAPPPGIDYGLDAITWSPGCMGWYFSTEIPFIGGGGAMIGLGDVLCAVHGEVFKSNAELLAKFHPEPPGTVDRGLDAVYLWDGGHVWFSLETGFKDQKYGSISDGYLLSSDGMVIHRNLALVARFEPIENVDNFGLDGLHLVPVQRGDMNGDAFIDAFDIDPFVLALVDPEAYYQLYPELDPDVVGDLNFDGVLNAFDIDPFVQLLVGG